MLSNGCGELSGTSMTVTPASINASPMASISSGFTPRRIATIGQYESAARRSMTMLLDQSRGARDPPVSGRDAIVRRERAVMAEQGERIGVALRERGACDDGHGAFGLPRRLRDFGADQADR